MSSKSEVSFTINGKAYSISPQTVPIDTTLNSFIRNHAKLSGTKFMCLEGGCGACIVSLKGVHPITKQHQTWATNSCLQNVYSCHELDVITVEGLGSKKMGMHAIQKRLADFNGTQCGYCSPGMVMNMHSLLESKNGKVTMAEIENSFGGNICRCTGYRPILDAFKSLATDADESLKSLCGDIEDLSLKKICSKTGLACCGKCDGNSKSTTDPIKLKFDDDREWHRVTTVKEIGEIFGQIGDKKYMLVAGNTAHGVYRRSPDLKVFIDISAVNELRTYYNKTSDSLEIGANTSLSETMEIFTKVAAEDRNFSYLAELVKHIDLIANVPVRNNGTLAGNLMIKNQHHDFPSDLFLLFETVKANLTIFGDNMFTFLFANSGNKDISLEDFMKLDMNKKILLKIKFPAYNPDKFIFRSHKIMPRAQNSHAYVNSAFLVEFNDQKTSIVSVRVCFGGIEPTFIHAAKTEAYLTGKDLFDNSTVQSTLDVLKEELKPNWHLPDASPEYRKNLALSLFYKFVLNIVPDSKAFSKFKSGGKILERGISSGTQTFDTYEKNWPLTKNIPKIEADVQCTGEAKYVNDLPSLPNEVYAAFVTAKKVHGKIASIDASKALKIPGVIAFYGAKDIPGVNNFALLKTMFPAEIEKVFCNSDVLFYNQPAGVIIAESNELANRAAEFVEIHYENETIDKKILSTIESAMQREPHRIQNLPHFSSVAAEVSTQQAPHKIKGRFEVGLQYHFTMEPQTTIAIPSEEGVEVHSATQWIDATQVVIAEALKLPNSAVDVAVRRVGGAYGAKISRSQQIAVAAAVAAHLSNRPVRFIMTIEANMNIVGKRYACISDYELTFDDNGKIQYLKNDYVEDSGCSPNEPVQFGTSEFFPNCYDKRHFTVNAKAIVTDAPSNTWCRAPGTVEGVAMIENIMEHIASKLGKDPYDVRMSNIEDSNEMKKILPDFVKSVDYHNRRKEIDEFNANNRWTKKGIAVVPLQYHLGYFGNYHAIVSIFHGDGSVAVSVGGIEMGQGLNTKVAQTTAHLLGVPLEKVSVKPSNTLTAPNNMCTGGSSGSEVSCFAVKKACESLLERMKPIRDENPKVDWSQLVDKAFEKNVDLCETYMFKQNDVKEYNLWAASCCEIEVDVLTGNIQIRRVDIMEDVGESLSPGIDVGQIEGAFVMGLGYWLTESLVYDRQSGELLTNRTWNYKPPGAKDIPIDFRITFMKKSSNPFGVLRSKATGEPAVAMSIVAVAALRHALNSARKDSAKSEEQDFYQLGAPTTAEQIFLAAFNDEKQYVLN